MVILNLTQHPGTPEQGVTDLTGDSLAALKDALTFESLPSPGEIADRAEYIAELAVHNGLGGDDGDDPLPSAAMIGGAPYLMSALERALLERGIEPLYAFSVRESTEQVLPDRTIQKINFFRHAGFVHMTKPLRLFSELRMEKLVKLAASHNRVIRPLLARYEARKKEIEDAQNANELQSIETDLTKA